MLKVDRDLTQTETICQDYHAAAYFFLTSPRRKVYI
jgi:hypothetical protein